MWWSCDTAVSVWLVTWCSMHSYVIDHVMLQAQLYANTKCLLTGWLAVSMDHLHILQDCRAPASIQHCHDSPSLHIDLWRLDPVHRVFKLWHTTRKPHSYWITLDNKLVIRSIDEHWLDGVGALVCPVYHLLSQVEGNWTNAVQVLVDNSMGWTSCDDSLKIVDTVVSPVQHPEEMYTRVKLN